MVVPGHEAIEFLVPWVLWDGQWVPWRYLYYYYYLIFFMCMCVCNVSECVEVRGQFHGVGSLLPSLCGF